MDSKSFRIVNFLVLIQYGVTVLADDEIKLENLISVLSTVSHCDMISLPNDQGNFIELTVGEIEVPHMEIQEVSSSVFPMVSCSVIILPTNQPERLNATVAAILDSRSEVTLTLVTNSSKLEEDLDTKWPKRTFDAFIFYASSNFTDHSVKHLLVSDLQSWKNVKVSYRPFMYWIMQAPDGSYYGPDFNVLEQVAKEANITFSFQRARNFAGMINEVGNGTADMAISQATYSQGRYETAGDVSVPFTANSFYFLVRRPQEINPIWTLTYPFDSAIWILLGASLIAVAISLSFANLIPFENLRTRLLSGFDIVCICLHSLLNEAAPPKLYNGKLFSRYLTLLFFVWLPCAVLLSLSYKSILLASLVSVEQAEAVDTWQKLIDHKYTVLMFRGMIFADLMRESPRPVVRQVYQECLVGRNGYFYPRFSLEQQKVLDDGKGVTIGAKEYAPGSLTGKRHRYMAGEELAHSFVGIHFVKRFPWKHQVNKVIGYLTAAGLIRKDAMDVGFTREKPERDHARTTPVNSEKKLTLSHFNFTWAGIGVGLVIAALAFAMEKMWTKCCI